MGGYVDSAEKNQSHNIPHGYTRRLSPSIEIWQHKIYLYSVLTGLIQKTLSLNDWASILKLAGERERERFFASTARGRHITAASSSTCPSLDWASICKPTITLTSGIVPRYPAGHITTIQFFTWCVLSRSCKALLKLWVWWWKECRRDPGSKKPTTPKRHSQPRRMFFNRYQVLLPAAFPKLILYPTSWRKYCQSFCTYPYQAQAPRGFLYMVCGLWIRFSVC